MEELLTITPTSENFEYWLNQPFIDDALREELRSASVLLVPTIGFRNDDELTFPVETEQFLGYLKRNLPDGITVDICIEAEQYQELSLNSNYRRIGTFVVASVILPAFLQIFSSYVYDSYIKPKEQSQPSATVSSSVNIDNSVHVNATDSPPLAHHKKNKKKGADASIASERKTVVKEYMAPPKVKFTLIVVNDSTGESKEFSYDGPAEDVSKVVKALGESKLMSNEDKRNN